MNIDGRVAGVPQITIKDVLEDLATSAQRRLLGKHNRADVSALSRTYRGDWAKLIGELRPQELRRALSTLNDENALRAVVYRAFKRQSDQFDGLSFTNGATRPLVVKQVMKRLCGWDAAPDAVQPETFRALIERLDELGIEVLNQDRQPIRNAESENPGRDGQVRLRRKFR